MSAIMRSPPLVAPFGALFVLLFLIAAGRVDVVQAQTICTSDTNEFHMRVNLHAGE